MASFDLQQLFILAADLRHDALRLAWWRNMIGEGDHIQQVRSDTTQVHPFATNDQRPFNESVLLVELFDELAISCPGHINEIVYPGIHSVPCFHDARVIQVVPQSQVGTNIVLDGLECLGSVVDQFAWHVAEGGDNLIGIEALIVNPAHEAPRRLVGEVQRSRQQNEVFEPVVGSQGGIDRRENRADAPP